MAGDFDYVVDAAQHPDVAVFVALRGVAGEIDAGDAAPVFAGVAFVVAVDGAEHGGPRLLDGEVAGFAGPTGSPFRLTTLAIDAWQAAAWRSRVLWAWRRGAGKSGSSRFPFATRCPRWGSDSFRWLRNTISTRRD